ncbi:MAG TPA: hypothetical protein VHQ90_18515 [Thermoanaerobaculia bacterium]|nr:hypothetical protein [Thermoanaerobaculia bacterium]
MRLFPAGGSVPQVHSIVFGAGQARANNALIGLGAGGDFSAFCGMESTATVHLVVDITGYFAASQTE